MVSAKATSLFLPFSSSKPRSIRISFDPQNGHGLISIRALISNRSAKVLHATKSWIEAARLNLWRWMIDLEYRRRISHMLQHSAPAFHVSNRLPERQ